MAQTQLNYNQIMSGAHGEVFRKKIGAITNGAGDLLAGTIVVLDPATNKYVVWDSAAVAPVLTVDFTGETVTTGAVNSTPLVGVGVLLEDAAAAASEVDAAIGLSGTAFEDALILKGSTITTVTDYVKAVLQMNGIYVKTGTNSIRVAGEGV